VTDEPASSIERVRQAAAALGFPIQIQTMTESTRTAQDAAQAVGCDVAQIVKSLIFENQGNGNLVLLLVSGKHNVDTAFLATTEGLKLKRADVNRVREETGFAIGGVAPIGHLSPLPVYLDESILSFDCVWCAAGRPDSLFACSPQALLQATGARSLAIRA